MMWASDRRGKGHATVNMRTITFIFALTLTFLISLDVTYGEIS